MDTSPAGLARVFGSLDCLVILPDHKEYQVRRRIFNGLIDRNPAAIILPRSQAALQESFLAARGTGLPISVRGGGHNVAGLALVDAGIVIDNSFLRDVIIDPVSRIATVGPGALWADFDAAAQIYGLACPGGIVSDTGVAGLTLGGGIGWLNVMYGLACDALLSGDVILADGTSIEASEVVNEDLFWCLRGGGGNFGLVTRFRFRLQQLTKVYAGSIIYDFSQAKEALEKFWHMGQAAPDNLTVSLVATVRQGRKVVSIDVCYVGDAEDGRVITDLLLPTRYSALVGDSRRVRPYLTWQRAFDDDTRRGRRSYWRSIYIDDLSATFVNVFLDAVESAPSPFTMLTFDHIHGAAARVPTDATAFSQRNRKFLLLVNANWETPVEDRSNLDWCDSVFASLSGLGTGGGYINYLSNEGQKRISESYGSITYERLRQFKRRFDPENVFRATQNIPPWQIL
jgi:FAD/FMN-containing dehydrogenase